MGVFQDPQEQTCWWAVVKQKWQTKDQSGHVVYQDDGFLIVNFDFSADQKLLDFKIYYRLWFYDYKYDDVETGIKRYQKLTNDIKKYFVEGNKKNGEGLSSIDSTLKKSIMAHLIRQITTINVGKVKGK
jgi:hypothetical protein